jgi:hypothetical protein
MATAIATVLTGLFTGSSFIGVSRLIRANPHIGCSGVRFTPIVTRDLSGELHHHLVGWRVLTVEPRFLRTVAPF